MEAPTGIAAKRPAAYFGLVSFTGGPPTCEQLQLLHFQVVLSLVSRVVAPFARIKHLVTCRSQYNMHLLSLVPPPGLAHLPTQLAA